MEKLLKLKQAAEVLNVSDRMLAKLIGQGVIPCVRLGRCVRFRMADIVAFCEAGGAT